MLCDGRAHCDNDFNDPEILAKSCRLWEWKKPQKIVVISGYELGHVQSRLSRLQLGKLSENECSQLHWADYEFQSQTSILSSSIINEIEISSFCYVYIFRSIFPLATSSSSGGERKWEKKRISNFNPDQTPNRWCVIRSDSSGELFSFFLFLIDPAPTHRQSDFRSQFQHFHPLILEWISFQKTPPCAKSLYRWISGARRVQLIDLFRRASQPMVKWVCK